MVQKLIVYTVGAMLLLVAMVVIVPNFARSRVTAAANPCVANLRIIDGAKQQWALEYKKTTNDAPSWATLRPYLGRGPASMTPRCPEGGVYSLGRVGEPPRCTYPGHGLP